MMSKLFWAFFALVVFLSISAGCQFDTGMLPPEPTALVIKTISFPAPMGKWHNLSFIEWPNGLLEVQDYASKVSKEVLWPKEDFVTEFGIRTTIVIKEVISNDLKLKKDTSFITSYYFELLSDIDRKYQITITPHPTKTIVMISIQF